MVALSTKVGIDVGTLVTMDKVDLSGCKLNADDMYGIVDLLRANDKITRLSLKNNAIGDRGCAILATVLPYTSLTSVNLKWNNIADDGAAYLAIALLSSTTLSVQFLCVPLSLLPALVACTDALLARARRVNQTRNCAPISKLGHWGPKTLRTRVLDSVDVVAEGLAACPQHLQSKLAAALVATAAMADPEKYVRFAVDCVAQCDAAAARAGQDDIFARDKAQGAAKVLQLAVAGVIPTQLATDADELERIAEAHGLALAHAVAKNHGLLLAHPGARAKHWRLFGGNSAAFAREYATNMQLNGPAAWHEWIAASFVTAAIIAVQCVVQPIALVIMALLPPSHHLLEHLLSLRIRSGTPPRWMRWASQPLRYLWVADPFVRLTLHWLADATLLVLVLVVPALPTAPRLVLLVALGLAVASLLTEVDIWVSRGGPRAAAFISYLADRYVDLAGLILATVGFALALSDAASSVVGRVLAPAIILLGLRLLRVLVFLPRASAYVALLQRVAGEVLVLGLLVALPALVLVSAALAVLVRATAGDACATADLDGATALTDMLTQAAAIAEAAVGGAAPRLECLRDSAEGYLAWWIQVLVALPLGAVLIAATAALAVRSGQISMEGADVADALAVARIVQHAAALPTAPPPLNLLGLPFRLLFLILVVASAIVRCLWATVGLRRARYDELDEGAADASAAKALTDAEVERLLTLSAAAEANIGESMTQALDEANSFRSAVIHKLGDLAARVANVETATTDPRRKEADDGERTARLRALEAAVDAAKEAAKDEAAANAEALRSALDGTGDKLSAQLQEHMAKVTSAVSELTSHTAAVERAQETEGAKTLRAVDDLRAAIDDMRARVDARLSDVRAEVAELAEGHDTSRAGGLFGRRRGTPRRGDQRT